MKSIVVQKLRTLKNKGVVKKTAITTTAIGLVSSNVSAGTFDTIATLINDTRAIIKPTTDLVIDIAPLIITLVIITFITAVFAGIAYAVSKKLKF